MPVNLHSPLASALAAVPGIRLGTAQAGVRKVGRKDVCVMLLDEGSHAAGVFTRNRYCAAPVQVGREHLAQTSAIRAIVINTGNANAGTGADGLAKARKTCAAMAEHLGVASERVLPFSTGVIMEPLPVDKIIAHLPVAIADAKENQWLDAAQAIMTTDTVPKAASRSLTIDGRTVTVTGISKGAGMIRPNMATMLGFIATDACVAPGLLKSMVTAVAEQSFNRITVDGDTSTNDSLILVATQRAGHQPIDVLDSDAGQALMQVLIDVARELAQAIVRDGEGATKFITVRVEGGRDTEECRKVAYAIAHSPLVKTAFFASDPNLGRILAAVGYAGIDDLDQSGIALHLDDVHVVTAGGRNASYREEDGQRVMKQSEITIRVGLGRGEAVDTVWTCDFSHDYVTINADYRS